MEKILKEVETLGEVVVNEHHLGGVHIIVVFRNGYGASIVRHGYSYGHEDDLWEVAVIIHDYYGSDPEMMHWELCYDTPITDDVLGWLSDDDVVNTCKEISKLS